MRYIAFPLVLSNAMKFTMVKCSLAEYIKAQGKSEYYNTLVHSTRIEREYTLESVAVTVPAKNTTNFTKGSPC